ncbi:cytochrome c biogenesis protein [Lewinella sp. JB7]|uniref:cytochrome c biogenesis protein n=1 Tax=Lewinella sp. JB7 TaxID=2962887 RepID=UPI0020C93E2F|nr:cytochrome c biogenesis protein CcsA [Lewinella sp. JB7]MCP9235194.1 cytochrome c biogenesis protein [Lewinella sp. JB7]
MERLMRQHWWKLLSVLILVYALIAGMLVPLKPNLLSVSPSAATPGQSQSFELLGYNTRFAEDANSTRAWLNYGDGLALEATRVEVIDDRRATVTFDLPWHLPKEESGAASLSLIVSGTANGAFVTPGAIIFRQDAVSPDPAATRAAWSRSAPQAGDLTANPNMTFPYRGLLGETIRNTYFHVSLWFAMMFLFIAAVVYAIRYLMIKSRQDAARLDTDAGLTDLSALERTDQWSVVFTGVGMLFGVLGLLTGAVWAKYTWGSFWNWDIKQFTTLIALLIYAGYFVLRAAFPDPEQRARLGAVYNIFAFACLIPLIYILPRMSATSLHPGAEGNPAMGGEDLDNTMRMVFYPTIIGWTLFGGWMAGVAYRARVVGERLLRRQDSF